MIAVAGLGLARVISGVSLIGQVSGKALGRPSGEQKLVEGALGFTGEGL